MRYYDPHTFAWNHCVGPNGNMAGVVPQEVADFCDVENIPWYSDGSPYSSGIQVYCPDKEWTKIIKAFSNIKGGALKFQHNSNDNIIGKVESIVEDSEGGIKMYIGPKNIKTRKIEKTIMEVEHYISLNADEIAEILKEKLNDYDSDLYQSTYVADKVIFEIDHFYRTKSDIASEELKTYLKGAMIILK